MRRMASEVEIGESVEQGGSKSSAEEVADWKDGRVISK